MCKNQEKGLPERSAEAVISLRELFIKARKEGYFTQLWDIIGALRGPDSAGEAAQEEKDKKTKTIWDFCQIRSRLLGEDEDDPDQIEATLAPLIEVAMIRDDRAEFDVHHFATHLYRAETVCLEAIRHFKASKKGKGEDNEDR